MTDPSNFMPGSHTAVELFVEFFSSSFFFFFRGCYVRFLSIFKEQRRFLCVTVTATVMIILLTVGVLGIGRRALC